MIRGGVFITMLALLGAFGVAALFNPLAALAVLVGGNALLAFFIVAYTYIQYWLGNPDYQ